MVDLSRYLKNRELPLIMGIVNVTNDSFSNQGRCDTLESALKMLEDGADILDIGGESTRPDAEEISWEQEAARVLPLVIELKKACPKVLLSVDTRKLEVAERVLDEGVEIINDVSNLSFAPEIAGKVASYGAGLVLMHSRGTPQTMMSMCDYSDLVSEVRCSLAQSMELAIASGVKKDNIWIDPGLGFAKKGEQNFELLNGIKELKSLAPVLIGHSRKRFIRDFLGVNVDQADFGTAAISIYAMEQGAEILRVHDVKNNYDVLRMYKRCNCHE
jgi:dihydropteroate synthase